jgi:hypothetical protein
VRFAAGKLEEEGKQAVCILLFKDTGLLKSIKAISLKYVRLE